MLSKGYEYAHFLYYDACMYQIEQFRVQILVGADFFCSCSEQLWDPTSLLYGWYQVLEVEQLGFHIDHPPHLLLRLKKEYS
jgi:hypothetical protein